MKHIWVVESSGGRKWSPAEFTHFTKKDARRWMAVAAKQSPGLKWRVAKYARGEK